MLVEDGVEEARTVTVHVGVDVDRAARTEALNVRAAFWLPHDAPVVCNVGALVPSKGHRYLVEAAALVVRDVPDARFVILGEGELRPALEHQVRELHLERHVFLPGFRADVLALLKTVDLFAMSSVAEGLAVSLLDAMAVETAIVATEAGGIPEVVVAGETGLLVPPRNPQAMAVALVRLLRDGHERARMARAGLARVRERFSLERMIRDTVTVYERTLAERRRSADP
jgi:glycosyltransferase involved in cell wall biosynthesis